MKHTTGLLAVSGMLCQAAVAQTPPKTWPHPVPCRVKDGSNKDLLVMTLGDVSTPLADGVFHPVEDTVKLSDGTEKPHYFRDTLGVKHYRPLDKSRFPLPPSGWCTWYYYYTRLTATEVKHNAEWIAANLKDHGAQYVQIDDGWQGDGTKAGQRDWTTVNQQRVPDGMAELAARIKALGLTPGLWLAPHGQSNPQMVADNPGLFLMNKDGQSASDTWEGKYLLDPTAPGSEAYLEALFSKLTGWGYEYFKIDGQPIVVDEYRTKKEFMKTPSADFVGLYRNTLGTIRKTIGEDRFLLGCWGTPIEGAGIYNGSRTGGDVVLGWDGFKVALHATLPYLHLHNIVWYGDPDVLLVRSPLTLDQARVWATLQGLTGQALLSSDRLMDLPPERVELLKRVYPAVDARPLDLFPCERDKTIWDLKIKHLDRQYDVVGVFNFERGKSSRTHLAWQDLGLPGDQRLHVYDFWSKEYLGAWAGGMMVEAAPTSCRVFALVPATKRIELVSTSRHITQGWVDLKETKANADGTIWQGTSTLVKNDPYTLSFAFPTGANFKVKSATAKTAAGELAVHASNHQGWASLTMTPAQSGPVEWQVEFEPADFYQYPPSAPEQVTIERLDAETLMLRWKEQYWLNSGYQAYLDGTLLGYTPDNSFTLRGLDPQKPHTAEVRCVWQDGAESPPGAAKIEFTPAKLP